MGGYFRKTGFEASLRAAEKAGTTIDFYDANTGERLFTAPKGRTHAAFWSESVSHGWPSFRDAEVNWARVRCLQNGECVSLWDAPGVSSTTDHLSVVSSQWSVVSSKQTAVSSQ